MNILCPSKIDCPGSDFPIENYSAEDPDAARFCATAFAAAPVPLGYNPDCGTGSILDGFAKACSTVSYEDALLAAQQAALAGVISTWATPDCDPVDLVCNDEQVCTKDCPDGSSTTYTQIAGTICAESLDAANAEAQSVACNHAQGNLICLGDLVNYCCVGMAYTGYITASGGLSPSPIPNHWEIVSGSLPAGLTFHGGYIVGNQALITGTPTSYGVSTFTVQITSPTGNVGLRTFTLGTYSIDWTGAVPSYASLPDGTTGTGYAVSLTFPTTLPSVPTWSVIVGSLPPGLTLNPVLGTITGTPTTSGTYSFRVRIYSP